MTYEVQLLKLQLFLLMLQKKRLIWQYLKLQKVHYRLPLKYIALINYHSSQSTFLKDYGRIPEEFRMDSERIPTEFPNEFPQNFQMISQKEFQREFPKDIPKEFRREFPKEFMKGFPKEFPKDFLKKLSKNSQKNKLKQNHIFPYQEV